MEQKGDIGKDGSDPHKDKHLDANLGANVELILGCEGHLGRNANDGSNNGGNSQDNARQPSDKANNKGPPASYDDERCSDQQHHVEDTASHKEGVHYLLADAEEV